MKRNDNHTISIIGAGLTGCFAAIMFARRGYRVDVYERFSKEELINSYSARSFNLTIYNYGEKALREAGLWKSIKPELFSLSGSVNQAKPHGKLTYTALNKNVLYYAVQRARLLNALFKEAEKISLIKFHFGVSLLSVNRKEKKIYLLNSKSRKVVIVNSEAVLGTDGANSEVRGFLQQGQETRHIQENIPWSYKQIFINKEMAKKLGISKNAMYSWTRKEAIITALPNGDGSWAGMLVLPIGENQGFAGLTSDKEIAVFMEKNFPYLLPALPLITRSIRENQEGQFTNITTIPWYYQDFLLILGDAAHAFLPFFGQGVSAGFADVMELIGLVDSFGPDWGRIFPIFQMNRKRHADAISDLSKESFTKYRRDSRANYNAVMEKIESMLHKAYPKYFLPPIFEMVMIKPVHAADYLDSYRRQRSRFRWLGLPLIAAIITGGMWLKERIEEN
jgi:kynurenine 3-monooxygenase